MQLKTIVLLLLLSNTCLAQRPNYQVGDTLKVFTMGGLKLREGIGLSSKVIGSMKLGSKVVVLDHFDAAQKYFQTIEGFSGHWIQVQYDTLIGYAFDGFLSALPLPNTTPVKRAVRKRTPEELEEDESHRGLGIETAFIKYIESMFQNVCDPVEYYNGADGESSESLYIQKISRGFTKIDRRGWENSGTELVMPNVRFSEIKNLIILLAKGSDIDDATFEEVKKGIVKNVSEEKKEMQVVIQFELFVLLLKFYPSEHNEFKWAIEIETEPH
jgi:hypothetical protein